MDPGVNSTEIKTVSEKRDLGIGAGCFCPDYVNLNDILGNQNKWPSASSRFFIQDHKNEGGGLRGLVFNSVIDSKINNDFSSLTVNKMIFHLHIAVIHYRLPSTKSINIITMMMHLSTDQNHIIQKERDLRKKPITTP
jgi:hypothetical protein